MSHGHKQPLLPRSMIQNPMLFFLFLRFSGPSLIDLICIQSQNYQHESLWIFNMNRHKFRLTYILQSWFCFDEFDQNSSNSLNSSAPLGQRVVTSDADLHKNSKNLAGSLATSHYRKNVLSRIYVHTPTTIAPEDLTFSHCLRTKNVAKSFWFT